MTTPTADLQYWSQQVARDPGSLAFLPLAHALRKQGQRDAALRLVLRGLEHHPENVEAHSLLARLHLEAGERERAFDEWSVVLHLDPSNFEANRGTGFVALEANDYGRARRHLERAAAQRPEDPAVREALMLASARERVELEGFAGSGTGAGVGAGTGEGEGKGEQRVGASGADMMDSSAVAGTASPAEASTGARAAPALPRDPARVFQALHDETPFIGALILDAQGLVLAGSAGDGDGGSEEALAALLGGALEEVSRTLEHLGLGNWQALQMETANLKLRLSPLHGDAVLLLMVRKGTAAGWVVRVAQRASEVANRYLRGDS